MKSIKKILVAAVAVVSTMCILAGCIKYEDPRDRNRPDGDYLSGLHHVAIDVEDYGTIEVELDADEAPITVTNFINLAKSGFYDGLTFHRIMDGFMIQGGANPDVVLEPIPGEFASNGYENNISHTEGVISMARTNQPNSATSQFFITVADDTFLDGEYAAFGHVTEGLDICKKIAQDAKPIDNNGTIPDDQQPVIESIKITD